MPAKYYLLTALVCIGTLFSQNQPQYELQSIELRGNSEISSSSLSEVIYSKTTPWWFWKWLNTWTSFGSEPVYFDSTNIDVDIVALEQYYKANGFFQASFSYEYEVDTSALEVDLIYNVTENQHVNYGTIDLIGLDSVPYGIFEDLTTDLTLDSNERYMQTAVQENVDNFVSILKNSGYAFARFDSTVIFVDTSSARANLDIYFTPGLLYKVDTVLVRLSGEGAHYVDPSQISHITGIVKDEDYSAAEVSVGQARLVRTGLFNSISLAATDSGIKGDRLPLILEGSVGDMNEIIPEIILNNNQSALNVGLAGSYVRKNFFGRARRFSSKLSFGLQDIFNIEYANLFKKFSYKDTTLFGFVDASISIEQPYLFNESIHGILNNYFIIEKQQNYNVTRYGSKLTFDFELPHYTTLSTFSTYYNVEKTFEVYRNNSDSLSTRLLSVLGFDAARITTDNTLFPTKGYGITLQAEEANLLPFYIAKIFGTEFTGALFYRLQLTATYYQALDYKRNMITAAKFRTGYIQPYRGDYAGLPVSRTFYAGGSNSVRGWGANELKPTDAPLIQGFQGENFKGGTFLFEGSMEMRYRFLGSLGTALFFDYGNVWLSYKEFRFDELALTVGFGFRYYTQVAPFRIDFGFKFYDPENGLFIWDNWKNGFFPNLRFHFGIGEAF